MGRFIEHTSLYGTDLSFNENAQATMKTFVDLPAEVITQSVSRIHEEFSKCIHDDNFTVSLEEKRSPLTQLHGIQECFMMIKNQSGKATEDLS
jgi:hypothetical protein